MNMLMKSKLLTSPVEIGNRLEALGWSREQLLEVVDCMVSARNSCTENDPPTAPGWKSWCDGTRRLREIGALQGWERSEEDQISSAYDRKRGIKIAVCNTDDGTGIETSQPQNRNKKGAATDRVISINQSVFSEILDQALSVAPISKDSSGGIYWYLCVYCEGDVFRAELSCPSVCEGGFFTAFSERIILVGGDADGSGVRKRHDAPDGDSGFEIKVTRKQA